MKIMVSAYLDNNIGDDLMIKLLSDYFENHSFYLYSNRTVIKNTFKNCKNIIVRNPKEQKCDIVKMDAFLSIGGSIFNDLNSLKGQIVRLKKISLLKKAKRNKLKIATIGCNLGPYKNKRGIFFTRLELKTNDLITVRDKESFDLVKGFKIKNIHLADDIVYNLKIEHDNINKSGLGISVYRSKNIGEKNYENYRTLAMIVDEYIEKTQKNVKLFAFDTENENDLSAAHHVLNLCNYKGKIEIVPYLGDEISFIEKMNECEKFISIRFHSAVLSDILEKPFLPVIYSNKMSSLLKDRDYKGKRYLLNELDINNIKDIVDVIIEGKELYTKFHKSGNNSIVHFKELERLLHK